MTNFLRNLLTIVTMLLVLGVAYGVVMHFYSLVAVLSVSTLITYLLLGPVNGVEQALSAKLRKHLSPHLISRVQPHYRLFAIVTVYGLLILTGSGFVFQCMPLLRHQYDTFKQALPSYLVKVEKSFEELTGESLGFDQANVPKTDVTPVFPTNQAQDFKDQNFKQWILRTVYHQVLNFFDRLLPTLLNTSAKLIPFSIHLLIDLIAINALVFYFLKDGAQGMAKLLRCLPASARPVAKDLALQIHAVLLSFVKGQVLLAVLSSVLVFILYTIFHVKYALFLSAFFLVAEIIPVIGPWIAFLPGFLVMLFSPNPWVTLYVWGLYVAIKDNLLLPRVIGHYMALNPIVIILALLIFAKLAGFVGLMICVPVTSVAYATLRFVSHRQKIHPKM